MSENPLMEYILHSLENVSGFIRTRLSNSGIDSDSQSPKRNYLLSSSQFSNLSPASADSHSFHPKHPIKGKSEGPVSKEELGRASWTFLHTFAARYPEKPSRQQKKDAKELMAILSRMYPCKECADHFKEILRENPAQVGSHAEFSQWLCYVHNLVNRSLGKPVFPFERIEARWGKSECENRECDVLGDKLDFPTGPR